MVVFAPFCTMRQFGDGPLSIPRGFRLAWVQAWVKLAGLVRVGVVNKRLNACYKVKTIAIAQVREIWMNGF